MKITLNKYQKLMATALELGNINVSGPACTGKTHFAAHWAAEKVEMYKDHPDGADVILHVRSLRSPWLIHAFVSALGFHVQEMEGRGYPYYQVGNVTVHLLSGNDRANIGPAKRPVFYVQDDVLEWGPCFCRDLPVGFRAIRIAKSAWDDPEFRLDLNPVDGGALPRHNQL